MNTTTFKDVAVLALCGLIIGILAGVIAAGAYATWAVRGDMTTIGFGTILAFAPWEIGYFGEPFRTALIAGGLVAAVFTVATPALGFRKALTSHGTARWATAGEMKRRGYAAGLGRHLLGPIFGKFGGPRSRAPFLTTQTRLGQRNFIPHSLVTAPTGSGKGISIVIPTLLTWLGSIICLDPKGENFEKTARHRKAMGDRIFKFNPFADDDRTHRYNPLDYVVEAAPDRQFTEAKRVAASLIATESGGQDFLGGARSIFAATALVMIQRGTPTLAALYDALTQPGGYEKVLGELAMEAKAEAARSTFRHFAGMEARVLSSYMSLLMEGGLELWADPAVRAATAESDFRVHDLRRRPASIYITIAPNDIPILAPVVRILFQQTIGILQRREPKVPKRRGFFGRLIFGNKRPAGEAREIYPVLFLMDEFPKLKRMEVLAESIDMLRGYGGRVMLVVQSLAQLRDLYKEGGLQNILTNCRLQLFMSPADEGTPEYISKAIGDRTRKGQTKSWRSNEFQTQYQEREEGERLLRPEQARNLGDEHMVALVQNSDPVRLRRVIYFEDRVLAPIFKKQKGPLPEPPLPSERPKPARPITDNAPVAAPTVEQAPETSAEEDSVEQAPAAAAVQPVPEDPIQVPAPTVEQAPPPSPEPTVDVPATSANGAKMNGEHVEDEGDDDELPPEKERSYHKHLSHISIEVSHLNADVLHVLASQRASRPERPLAKKYSRQAPPAAESEATVGSAPPSHTRSGMGSGMNLSALRAARAKARGTSEPRTGTDD